MRLADDLLDYIQKRNMPQALGEALGDERAHRIEMAILQANRFVLSQQVQELVDNLAFHQTAELLKSRDTLFLPAPLTWIEWEHPAGRDPFRTDLVHREALGAARNGFLLIGVNMSDLHEGALLIVYRGGPDKVLMPIGAHFKLDGDGPLVRPVAGGEVVARELEEQWRIKTGEPAERLSQRIYVEIGLALAAMLALLNAPRVTKLRPGTDLSKLNRARLRRGRTPFLTWRTVVINVDTPKAESVERKSETGHMPLHFVRSHLRRINGEWHLIAAHWRGNAEYGRVLKSYHAMRDQEARRRSSRPEPTREIIPQD